MQFILLYSYGTSEAQARLCKISALKIYCDYFTMVSKWAKVIYISQTQWVQDSQQHYFLKCKFLPSEYDALKHKQLRSSKTC